MRPRAVALTVAGSDSGGGAGIQADLKTFAALGVHGTSAITCLTAQNPGAVTAIEASKPEMVQAQIKAVFDGLPPAAVKTGMLYSAGIVRVVADFFTKTDRPPLVVDPVMVASSGASLLKPAVVQVLFRELLPLATLLTPNLDEASVMVGGQKLGCVDHMREAARQIHRQFGAAVLAKGGHLRGLRQAVDIFYDGKTELLLEAPFVRGMSTHGTGCTYSAAVTAFLARGRTLMGSVKLAKEHITQAVAHSYRVGAHQALEPFWRSR